jgi:hypothetical protein
MKVAWLLFLTMSCAGLMLGTGYVAPSQQMTAGRPANEGSTNPTSDRSHGDRLQATPADEGKRQKEQGPSEQQASRRVAAKNRSLSHAGLTIAKHPTPPPIRRGRSKPLNATNLDPADPDLSGDAAKGPDRTASDALPVRSTRVVRPTVASLNPVRHHGARPAVVGGSASNTSNTGGLNGTGMHRKP